MTNTLKAVLLDIDGTLVDSNDAHAAAWIEALREAGYDASYERVRALIGKGGDKLLPEVTGLRKDSALGEEISARRGAIFKKTYLPSLRAFAESRNLLARMKSMGMRLVVASSASDKELAPLLRIAEVEDLIEKRTSSADVDHSKPDPDIIEVALARAGCAPHEAMMLGDTPYDVESARKAGVSTIAVRSGGWSDEDLRGAVAIFDNVADLFRSFDDSPLVRARP